MRVLVTGGTGFVGSHVARQLVEGGQTVRLLVRDINKAESLFTDRGDPGVDTAKLEFFQGDVTDAAQVDAAMQDCEAVVHAAAGTPIALPSLTELNAVNVGGTRNVMTGAVRAGLQSIVHVSSATAIFRTKVNDINIEAPLSMPRMPYGRSKVEAENIARDLQKQGAPVSIIYPSGIIGPDDPGFSDAFKALHHRINHGFRLFDDGGIQQIDVRDLAAFIVSLAVDGPAKTGCGRHLVVGRYLKWTEQADIIDQVTGSLLQRIPVKGWKMRFIGRLMDLMRLVKTVDSPISAETMRYATQWPDMPNTPELAERGLTLRSPVESITDSIQWMLRAGHLSPEQAPGLVEGLG